MKKSILVKQRDISDCGAACLASVAAYYGLQIPVSRIRQFAGTDKKGTTLKGLIDAAEKLGLQSRGAKADGVAVSQVPVPSIFHLALENGLQHFVVVYRFRKRNIHWMDPAAGKIVKQDLSEFKKKWTGVVLLLMPSSGFKKGKETVPIYKRFIGLISPHRAMLIRAIAAAIVYTLLGLSMSIYVQKILDDVIPDSNFQLLSLLGAAMIILLCFRVIAGYFKSLIALCTGQHIDSWLVLGYFRHLLHLPQRFFDTMRAGEIISRVNDALRIRVFINDVAINLVVHALTVIFCLAGMFMFYWKLALIALLSIPVYLLYYLVSDHWNKKWQRKIMENGAALETQLVETIHGISTIRRFGTEDHSGLKIEFRFEELMRSIFFSSRAGLQVQTISEWTTGLLSVAILWYGSGLVMQRTLTPGELLSYFTLISFFTSPVQALIGANKQMQDAMIAADRLFEILDLEPEKEITKGLDISRFPDGDLVFSNIRFSYGSGTPVFNGLELRVRQNQMTAIIGESGSGKSTLLSLIQKVYPPELGNIMIGDLDIRDISTPLLRKQVAGVLQQTDLFQGDFIMNIAMGDQDPDLDKILGICRRLGLHEFIDQLPMRYHTVIKEQGNNLSGGQRQRIGIARALYQDPAILVLDEATSSLDPETEVRVLETIRWFYGRGKTVLFITHRPSVVRFCDSVVLLKTGGHTISGTHELLLAANNDYGQWWKGNYPD